MDNVLPQTEATFTNVDLIVLSPGVPIDIRSGCCGSREGHPYHRRSRAGELFSSRPGLRYHRVERQDDHDGSDWSPAERVWNPVPSGRKHRHAANRDDRIFERRSVECA